MRLFLVGLLVLCVAGFCFAGGSEKIGPIPREGISCISVEMDGAQLYHQDFVKPLHSMKEVEAQARELGKSIQVRGLITGEGRVKSDGDRLLASLENGTAGYYVGNVCYVLMRYCAPGCGGQWCVGVRVPSVQ